MQYKTRQFVFHRTYEMASMVEACAINSSSFIEIDWESPEVLRCLVEFSKKSLLHHYIYAMISVYERENFSDRDDIYEDSEEERESIEVDFRAYNIDLLPYSKFFLENADSEGDSLFRKWFDSQQDKFELLWEKMTDDVFHLLFANRAFLLQFNRSLAKYLQSGEVNLPAEYLDEKGVLKRQSYFPSWLKKAVFYREQGKCVLCQRDLSGLLNTDQRIHYDHIVPLNLWGSNDPSNLQLLCEDCNLKKSGTSAKTATRYNPWWSS